MDKLQKTILLDMWEERMAVISSKQFDRNARQIVFELQNDGAAYQIPQAIGVTVRVEYLKPDANPVYDVCTINSDGTITVDITEQMDAVAGECIGRLEITDVTDKDNPKVTHSSKFKIQVEDKVIDDNAVTSTYEFNALQDEIIKSDAATAACLNATSAATTAAQNLETLKTDCVTATNNANTAAQNLETLKTDCATATNDANNATTDSTAQTALCKTATDTANTAAQQFGQYTNEIVTARGSFPNLDARLDENATDVNNRIAAVANGSPKGVYPTVSALTSAFSTGNTNTYIVNADGNWYYWNGANWVSGGLYQSTGILDGSVTEMKLDAGIQSALDDNYQDITLNWNSGSYYNRLGVLTTANGFYYADIIAVNPGEKYRITGTNGHYESNLFVIINAAGTKVLAYPDVNVTTPQLINYEFTIPQSGAKLLINRSYFTSSFQFVHLAKKISNKPKISVNDIDDYSGIIDKPINLFNVADSSNINGQYYYIGVLTSASGYLASHPIPVKPGDVISSTQATNSGITGNSTGVYMDANKNILYKIYNVINNTTYNTFTVPNDYNIKYVALSVLSANSNANSFMAVKNISYPSSYIAYTGLYELNENVGLNNTQKNQVNKSSKLYAKTILAEGDSICHGAGYANGYGGIIANNTGCNFINYAVNGGTLSSGSSKSTHYICQTVTNMQNTADLVCFEGGINDFWDDIPIGTVDLTSSNRFTNTLDTTTLCGALESIFRQAIQKWVGTPICFIITHKIQNTEVTTNNLGKTYTDYYNAIVTICEKYSIPYVDLFKHSGFNCGIDILSNTFTVSTSGNPDGCHPNKAGYDSYYVPQITKLFESIIKR